MVKFPELWFTQLAYSRDWRYVFMILAIFAYNGPLIAMKEITNPEIKNLEKTYKTAILEHRKKCDFCKHYLLCRDEFAIDEAFNEKLQELKLKENE